MGMERTWRLDGRDAGRRLGVRTLAARSLAAHRARLAMTLAAVAMGTAFVAGTLVFTD